MLSKPILTVKIMRKNNFKLQMLAGNRLKICVGASFEISMTLVDNCTILKILAHYATAATKNIWTTSWINQIWTTWILWTDFNFEQSLSYFWHLKFEFWISYIHTNIFQQKLNIFISHEYSIWVPNILLMLMLIPEP